MNKYPNHGCIVSYLLDCGVDKLVTLEQNFVDYTSSLDFKMSLKVLGATSTKFFGHHVLIVAHVDVNMNLSKRR
jgi:hypothetical protein